MPPSHIAHNWAKCLHGHILLIAIHVTDLKSALYSYDLYFCSSSMGHAAGGSV